MNTIFKGTSSVCILLLFSLLSAHSEEISSIIPHVPLSFFCLATVLKAMELPNDGLKAVKPSAKINASSLKFFSQVFVIAMKTGLIQKIGTKSGVIAVTTSCSSEAFGTGFH